MPVREHARRPFSGDRESCHRVNSARSLLSLKLYIVCDGSSLGSVLSGLIFCRFSGHGSQRQLFQLLGV